MNGNGWLHGRPTWSSGEAYTTSCDSRKDLWQVFNDEPNSDFYSWEGTAASVTVMTPCMMGWMRQI
jgi:hypothetical protein